MENQGRVIVQLIVLTLLLHLTGCYHSHRQTTHAALVEYNDKQRDSISFSTTHHYTNKYNFVVYADSLTLISQQPEEYVNGLTTDSFTVKKNCFMVVSDIRMIPQDSIDSVWVQLATEDNIFGWTHESDLLPNVVPDDPISWFILTFSNTHLIIFIIIIVVIGATYLIRKIFSDNGHLVHFNDIDSPYPTALVLTVSCAATFYATIQTFWPEMWRHFYFHPTLNPFAVPTALSFFLCSVWAIIIISIACVDEVRNRLPFGEAILYLCGLIAVCALNYIIFSLSTLYFVGYILLVAYCCFAIKRYITKK